MKYTTYFDETQEVEETEDYDYFNDGYPGDGYEDEFEGWRDLVL